MIRCTLLLALLCAAGWAADKSWVGGPGTWNTPASWSPAGVPEAGDQVTVSGATVTIPAATTAQCARVTVMYSSALTIAGSLDAADITLYGGSITWPGGTFVASNILVTAAGGTIETHANCRFEGVISGTGALTMYSGGILRHLQMDGRLSLFNGTWLIARNSSADRCGEFYLHPNGMYSFGWGHYSGDTYFENDWGSTPLRFADASSGSTRAWVYSTGAFCVGPIINDSRYDYPLINIGSGSLKTTVVDPASFLGRIEGSGGLIKAGSGPWTVRGELAHGGATTIQAGTLSLMEGSGRISASSGLRIDDGAVLALTPDATLTGNVDQLGDLIPVDLRGTLQVTVSDSSAIDLAESIGQLTCTGEASLLLAAGSDRSCMLTLAGLSITDALTVTRRHRGTTGLARCYIAGRAEGPVARAQVDGPDGAYRNDEGLIAATRRTTADGQWSAPRTWFGRVVPRADDDVTVAHAVSLDAAGVDVATLTFVGSGGTLSGTNALTVDAVRSEGGDSGSLAVPLASLPVKQGSGVVVLTAASATAGTQRVAAGTLTLAVGNALPSAILQVDAGATLVATADNACAGLTGAGTIDLGPYALTLAVADGDLAFAGGLTAGNLAKQGGGRQRLGGAGTVSSTTVSGGSLALSGIGSLSGDVEVAGGARCEGDGSIGGTLTVRSAGSVAPGLNTSTGHPISGTIGALQCNRLVLDGGANLDADLGLPADRLRVVGGLVLGATPATIHVAAAAGYTSNTWPVVDLDAAGSLTGSSVPQRGAAPGSNVVIELAGGDVLWRLDATPPVLSRITSPIADGTWHAGDSIVIALEYSEPVTLSGGMTATLGIRPTARTVTIAPGHGTTLTGTCTIQAGDWSADGGGAFARLDATALALAGTLVDDAGNAVTAPAALPAADGLLRATKALFVDNAAPAIGTNLTIPVSAGGSTPLAPRLVAADLETAQAQLAYTLELSPSQGVVERFSAGSWQGVATGAGWTQGELDGNLVRYRHTGALVGGSDAFAVIVHDSHATPARLKTTELSAVRVSISGVSAPAFDDPGMAIILVPGLTVSGTIHATDPQGTAVTYARINPSATTNGTFTIDAAGVWTYQHLTWTGLSDQVTVRATDAASETADLTIPVVVCSADDAAPRFRTAGPMWAQQGSLFSYSPTVGPGSGLVFTLIESPAGFAGSGGLFGGPANGTITWPGLPAAGDGYHRFGILAVDPATRRAGFQRIHLRVTATPPTGGG